MNKQKYIVMGLTFLILIILTPLIFSKLMNSKLNKMVENLNKEGYSVKLIKDKSSYLKTDKVFLVDIPGVKLNNQLIDNLEFRIETIFNNLPVTKVDFKGILERIDLTAKEYNNDINSLLDKKIKFFATTPNFKVYDYKIEDINLLLNQAKIKIKGIKGVFEYSDVETNKLSIDDVSLMADNLLFEIKNIKNKSFYKKNDIKSENRFDFYLTAANNKIQIDNVKISTHSLIDKKTSVISKISFDKFVSSFFNMDGFIFNFNLLNLDTATLIAIAKTSDTYTANKLSMDLLKKGLEINIYSPGFNKYMNKVEHLNELGIWDIVVIAQDINGFYHKKIKTIYVANLISNNNKLFLKKGWNLISADLNLNNLNKNIKLIYLYKDNKWYAYTNDEKLKELILKKSNINWFNKNSISANFGIWVYLTNDTIISDISSKITDLKPYKNKWNLSGTSKDISVNDIRCKYSDKYVIWKYKNKKWKLYYSNGRISNFESFDKIFAYEGFWVGCFQ
jgi:hypothetical protein